MAGPLLGRCWSVFRSRGAPRKKNSMSKIFEQKQAISKDQVILYCINFKGSPFTPTRGSAADSMQ
jgi:hypothetical protein